MDNKVDLKDLTTEIQYISGKIDSLYQDKNEWKGEIYMRKRMKKLICILIAATMVTTANSFIPSMNVCAEDSQAGATNGTYGDT